MMLKHLLSFLFSIFYHGRPSDQLSGTSDTRSMMTYEMPKMQWYSNSVYASKSSYRIWGKTKHLSGKATALAVAEIDTFMHFSNHHSLQIVK